VAAEFLGHTSIEMTARIYTHSSTESFESARLMIDNLANNGTENGRIETQKYLPNVARGTENTA
jgi:hypothetical protein